MKLLIPLLLLSLTTHAQIRCIGTIYTTPLVVVDNYPYEGSIDSLHVKSITVLCDDVAGSIYGWRAKAFGVVIIETVNYKPKKYKHHGKIKN